MLPHAPIFTLGEACAKKREIKVKNDIKRARAPAWVILMENGAVGVPPAMAA